MSALIDSISIQSEPLLTDTGCPSSVAMTTAMEEQATVIQNYDAYSRESVDKIETTDTLLNSKHLLAEEVAEQGIISTATVIENRVSQGEPPPKGAISESAERDHHIVANESM